VRSSTNASAIAVVLSEIHAVKDGRWCTVLYDAVQYNEHEHVEQLLNYGACPNLGHVHQNVITLCLRDDSVSRSLLLAAGGFSGTSDARFKEWGRYHARPARMAWMQAVARAWRKIVECPLCVEDVRYWASIIQFDVPLDRLRNLFSPVPSTWQCKPGCVCWAPPTTDGVDATFHAAVHHAVAQGFLDLRPVQTCVNDARRAGVGGRDIARALSQMHAVVGKWTTLLYAATKMEDCIWLLDQGVCPNIGAYDPLNNSFGLFTVAACRMDPCTTTGASFMLTQMHLAGGLAIKHEVDDGRNRIRSPVKWLACRMDQAREWDRFHGRPVKLAWMHAVVRAYRA